MFHPFPGGGDGILHADELGFEGFGRGADIGGLGAGGDLEALADLMLGLHLH